MKRSPSCDVRVFILTSHLNAASNEPPSHFDVAGGMPIICVVGLLIKAPITTAGGSGACSHDEGSQNVNPLEELHRSVESESQPAAVLVKRLHLSTIAITTSVTFFWTVHVVCAPAVFR